MILVQVGFGVQKDDVWVKGLFEADHVLQDFLAELLKTTRLESAEDRLFFLDTKDSHAVVMFSHYIFQEWVLLIVRQRHTQHFCLTGYVRNQRAATDLNIVRVSAKKENFLTEKGHIVIHIHLFRGEDSTDHFCHDELPITVEAFLSNKSNLLHDLFKIILAGEKAAPKPAVFG